MTYDPVLDHAAKLRVRDAARAAILAEFRPIAAETAVDRAAAELDPADSYSPDDLSQSDQDGSFVENLGAIADGVRSSLAELDDLDFAVTETVGPGAIIGFDGGRYLVGVAVASFTCDGAVYEGIALDAPLYGAVAEHRVGDEFDFRGRTSHLDIVI